MKMKPAHHFKTLETAFNTARNKAKFKTAKYHEGEFKDAKITLCFLSAPVLSIQCVFVSKSTKRTESNSGT